MARLTKFKINKQLGLLLRAQNFSQGEIAKRSKLSRVTINRFLAGKSQLKANDLITVMKNVGLDIDQFIQNKIESLTEDHNKSSRSQLTSDVGEILNSLDSTIKKTLVEQIAWWGKTIKGKDTKLVLKRLEGYYQSRD